MVTRAKGAKHIYEKVTVPPLSERIRVGHVHQDEGLLVAAPTLFQNPYRSLSISRDEKIRRYRQDLEEDLRARRSRRYRAMRVLAKRVLFGGEHGLGESLTLTCFCHPLPCHADAIRDAIYQLAEELQTEKESAA